MRPGGLGRQTLLVAFRNAFVGVGDFVKERNSRIQMGFAAAAVGVAIFVRLPAAQWAVLALAIVTVLGLEAMNCALERVVDLASPQYHELARQAKDLAAAGVLIASFGAATVGLLLFVPPLIALWRL